MLDVFMSIKGMKPCCGLQETKEIGRR